MLTPCATQQHQLQTKQLLQLPTHLSPGGSVLPLSGLHLPSILVLWQLASSQNLVTQQQST